MVNIRGCSRLRHGVLTLMLALAPHNTIAHGGVVLEGDLCVIQVGFYKAHFTVYQPSTRAHEEYCEDLPDVTESVFVLEYLHDGLEQMPVDFRIIRDVTELGRFAKWQDIAAITDLEAATVLYEPATIEPDVFAVVHDFDEPGDYIGIVTSKNPASDEIYTAVFPFEVGFTGFGYVPLFVALVVAAQLLFWKISGGFNRLRMKRGAAVTCLVALTTSGADAQITSPDPAFTQTSNTGRYQLTFTSRHNPIPINQIHEWVVHLETAAGERVVDAKIAITGGMPAHDHGLPTAPRMTEYLGNGDYRIEGVKFHMNGGWEITFTLDVDGYQDTVTISVAL